ncbi:hypothetical protein K7X08_015282 [Anisodus acutangulus]|uniref:Uncharacterized protein n=1 Tax=Anisodus acutangulus TaxID=402998 RepID=A0A9Q1L598_9SOLA|nr:hypothetical protein K7X08_015282 [Anisodus acutangulus]
MKSTISSLKDEQRIIEVALEEKQDEIKMLREKLTEKNQEDSQVKPLSESLQQKDAEIDLPKQLEEKPKKCMKRLKEMTRRIQQKIQRNAEAQDGERSADWKSNTGDQDSPELRTAQEDVPGNRSTVFQSLDGQRENTNCSKAREDFLEEKRYNSGDASVETINHSGQVQKQSKEVGVVDATDWKEHGTANGDDFTESQGNNQESGRKCKDALKLEMQSRVDQENIRRTKGKSRRIICRKRKQSSLKKYREVKQMTELEAVNRRNRNISKRRI